MYLDYRFGKLGSGRLGCLWGVVGVVWTWVWRTGHPTLSTSSTPDLATASLPFLHHAPQIQATSQDLATHNRPAVFSTPAVSLDRHDHHIASLSHPTPSHGSARDTSLPQNKLPLFNRGLLLVLRAAVAAVAALGLPASRWTSCPCSS